MSLIMSICCAVTSLPFMKWLIYWTAGVSDLLFDRMCKRGYRGGSPTAVQAWQPCPLWELSPSRPCYCRLGDLLCYNCMLYLSYHFVCMHVYFVFSLFSGLFSFVDFPSVLWYSWLGLLTCKNRLPYNLYCVGGDVKHCTIQSNPIVINATVFLNRDINIIWLLLEAF